MVLSTIAQYNLFILLIIIAKRSYVIQPSYKMRLIFIILIAVSFIPGYSQESFYKIHPLQFFQTKAGDMIEVNDKLYVAGMALDSSILPLERNLHLTSFDLDGNPLKSLYWNNLDSDDEMSMLWPNFLYKDGEFFIPYDNFGDQCSIRIDRELSSSSLISCTPRDGGNVAITLYLSLIHI